MAISWVNPYSYFFNDEVSTTLDLVISSEASEIMVFILG